MERVNIQADEVGLIRAEFAHDWRYGVTAYRVNAAWVSGVFVLGIEPRTGEGSALIDQDSERLRVEFGRRDGGDPYYSHHRHRADLPCVNGVELLGTVGVNLEQLRRERLTGERMYVGRAAGPGRAPEATTRRTALVVDALAYHWLSLPENYALRLHAARAVVGEVISERARRIRSARDELASAQAEIAAAKAEIAAVVRLKAIGETEEAAA
ncbi:hypothetical protein GCM10009789_83230 [Kribbella sancticallisti]|uniref:Uncharacterized protein n=1 Tax=Kribbella sancticallisti TaxID=460087 RepID=A0ABP4QNI6_9ACTN